MSAYYARFECNGCKEELIVHLRNVGDCACKIADKIKNNFGYNSINPESAKIAGYLHDIFKVVYNLYFGDPNKRCGEDPEFKLRFWHHEVLSAVYLANLFTRVNLNLTVNDMKAAVKAVLLHHQGLRRITYEEFFKGYENIMDVVRRVGVNKVLNEVDKILNQLNINVKSDDLMLRFETIYEFLKGGQIEDRIITGTLMIADNYVASECCSKQNYAEFSVLLTEVKDFVENLNLSC